MALPAIEMSEALLNAFYKSTNNEAPAGLNEQVETVMTSDDTFIQKVKGLDSITESFKIPNDVGELLFDVLLYNFFSEDSQRLGETFFEGEEWEQIEAAIIDRGSELMNILLYLQECQDSEINYSLDDYLDEYLVAEDDFDSEEHEVYEAILKNRDAIEEGDLQTMVEISQNNSDSALDDQLLPLLLFFKTEDSLDKKYEIIKSSGTNPGFQGAFLAALSHFKI